MTVTRRFWSHVADNVELNVVIFAVLLNFPWEFLQAPFYKGLASAPHWEATKSCAQAALGDAGVTLVAYWLVGAALRSRQWILAPGLGAVMGFIGADIVVNFGIEKLATERFERWAYTDSMPIVPVLDIGLLPLLQWVLLSPVTCWFVRRQLK